MTITRTPDTNESTTERFLRFLEHKASIQEGSSSRNYPSLSWTYETYCNARCQNNSQPTIFETKDDYYLTPINHAFKIISFLEMDTFYIL